MTITMVVNMDNTTTINQRGQGLVEYTLIVLIVALFFFVGVRKTTLASKLVNQWSQVKAMVAGGSSSNNQGNGNNGQGGQQGGNN